MGMAASQARYLALTARKSNVEFQGQQINQQRTQLACEQSELYAELAALKNPIAPSEYDYQYDSYNFRAIVDNQQYTYIIRKDSIVDYDDEKKMSVSWDDADNKITYKSEITGKFNANNTMFTIDDVGTTGLTTGTTWEISSGTWEDTDAYNEAYNKWRNDQSVYDHKIDEINAKSEQIQIQDRTLEMKLRNLDTEQEAIQTELDSVKKVIEDTIKNVFKTFQSS